MAANKTIGGINVTITATIEKFAKNITAARRMIGTFTKSVSGLVFSLKGLGAALAIGSVGKFVADQFEAISALKDLSDKTGVSTERLAGLQLAAEEAGIATSTLEKALVKLNNTTGLRGDIALREWIDKASKLTTQQEKLADATKTFGARGADMVRFLNGGTAAIDEAQDAANKLGLAVSNEVADKVDKAAESFARFKMAATGVFRDLAIEITPLVEAMGGLADELRDVFQFVKGLGSIELVRDANGKIISYNTYGPTAASLSTSPLPASSAWAAFARVPHTQAEINAFKMQRMLAGDFSNDDMVQNAITMHRSAMDTTAPAGGMFSRLADSFVSKWQSANGMYDKAKGGLATTQEEYATKTIDQFKSAFAPLTKELEKLKKVAGTRIGGQRLDDIAGVATGWRWMLGEQLAQGVGGLGLDRWAKADAIKPRSMERPGLSFAESGSVESYRQQAAIRRQSENIAKKQLGVQEQIRDGINNLADVINFPAANFGKA